MPAEWCGVYAVTVPCGDDGERFVKARARRLHCNDIACPAVAQKNGLGHSQPVEKVAIEQYQFGRTDGCVQPICDRLIGPAAKSFEFSVHRCSSL